MITEIYSHKLNDLQESLNRLNKRAKRLGLSTQFSFEVLLTKIEKKWIGEDCFLQPIYKYLEVSEIKLSGNENLKLGDYDLIASVERLDKDVIIKVNPNFPDVNLVNFRENNTGYCQHCKVKRYRKELVLLKKSNSTEEIFQVGKTCLKDFLGHKNPEKIIDLLNILSKELIALEDNNSESSNKHPHLIDVKFAIALSFSHIRNNGFKSNKANEYEVDQITTSTKNDLIDHLCKLSKGYRDNEEKEYYSKLEPKEKDYQYINSFLTWLENKAYSEYWQNVKTICNQELVKFDHLGYLSSAVNLFLKDQVQQAKFQEKTKDLKDGLFGNSNQRYKKQKVVCDSFKLGQNDYGTYAIISFLTSDNYKLVWFTNSEIVDDPEYLESLVRKELIIDFTVNTYNEKFKNTNIKRVKINN